jgi:hypothetical protein
MPMPPPRATTEGPRDRQVFHEQGMIVRALEARGAMAPEALKEVVGGDFWEEGRFDRALAFVVADGLAFLTDEGVLTTP